MVSKKFETSGERLPQECRNSIAVTLTS